MVAKRDFVESVQDILLRAEFDVQVNYAKTLQPLAEKYAKLLKSLQFNKNCNETCVVSECFNTRNWVMNWSCPADTCECNLKNKNDTLEAFENLEDEAENVTGTVKNAIHEVHDELAQAYKSYRSKVLRITTDSKNQIEEQLKVLEPLLELLPKKQEPQAAGEYSAERQQCISRNCYYYYGNDQYTYGQCVDYCLRTYYQ